MAAFEGLDFGRLLVPCILNFKLYHTGCSGTTEVSQRVRCGLGRSPGAYEACGCLRRDHILARPPQDSGAASNAGILFCTEQCCVQLVRLVDLRRVYYGRSTARSQNEVKTARRVAETSVRAMPVGLIAILLDVSG